MQQVEKGRISLDDDINRSLRFSLRNPNWPGVPITWRMLMTHSSSIDVDQSVEDSVYFYGIESPVSLETYLESVLKPGGVQYRAESFRQRQPGTERIYSDIAVDLLGYALTRVAHEDKASRAVAITAKQPVAMDDSTTPRCFASVTPGPSRIVAGAFGPPEIP